MVTLTLLLAALYFAGVTIVWRRAGFGRGVRVSQLVCFVAAITVLLVASGPPLDSMSDALFSAHMAQHVLLATVAPPLLVLGAPQVAIAWVLPLAMRKAIAAPVLRATWLRGCWRFLTAPLTAVLVHACAIWVWHAPSLYQQALQHEFVHVVEHLSFVISALLLWWGIVHPAGNRRNGYAIGILTMFVTAMHTGALGALFTLSHRVWYPVHIPLAAAWGTSALEDQQLAGLIMWVVGGLLYVVAMSALFVAWVRVTALRAVRAGLHSEHVRSDREVGTGTAPLSAGHVPHAQQAAAAS